MTPVVPPLPDAPAQVRFLGNVLQMHSLTADQVSDVAQLAAATIVLCVIWGAGLYIVGRFVFLLLSCLSDGGLRRLYERIRIWQRFP